MIRSVSAAEAKSLLHGDAEVAFLDVRDLADHGDGHPLLACPCPFSRLEPTAARLVPRRATTVLVLDGGDGLCGRAAERLAAAGYEDVRPVEGGLPAWRAAGYGVFEGIHVPSKTLGEILEQACHPRTLTARDLSAWVAAGRDHQLFDVRPPEEFRRATVPGARNAPNGELAHRLEAFAGSGSGPIVLTCAGRTRGILGAVGLALAGVERPVFALEDGTQGWTLAGYPLAKGDPATGLPPADAERSRERARRVAAAAQVPFLEAGEAFRLAGDPERTTYVFDLRSLEEREAAPLPGARPAPGVQLVQASDLFMAVRRARVILVDDTGLRGALAAAGLRWMGFDARVLEHSPTKWNRLVDERMLQVIESGAISCRPGDSVRSESALALADAEGVPAFPAAADWTPPVVPIVAAEEAAHRVRLGQALVVDLRPWSDHARARPAGSLWSHRAALFAAPPPTGHDLLVLANDPIAAALAIGDLAANGRSASLVAGGWAAFVAAGGPVETGGTLPPRRDLDTVWFAAGRHDGDLAAARTYLAWERGLVDRLDAEERLEFHPPRGLVADPGEPGAGSAG